MEINLKKGDICIFLHCTAKPHVVGTFLIRAEEINLVSYNNQKGGEKPEDAYNSISSVLSKHQHSPPHREKEKEGGCFW